MNTVFSRLYDKMFLRRIDQWTRVYNTNQLANRKGHQAAEGVHTTRRIMEKAHLHQIPLVMAKLDVQKAFDSIKHKSVTAALVGIGVPK